MTVSEMLQKMSSREFAEWMAFHGIEPFGDEWRQTGMACSVQANVWKGKGKAFSVEDFMPVSVRHEEKSVGEQHKGFRAGVKK